VVPPSGSPRLGAGEPIVNDYWKCQLKPLTRQGFPSTVTFTRAEWAQLQSAFPTGVCDYTKPAVARQRTVPWLTYQTARGALVHGGTPLGEPPRSISFSA
jgi:hypothetical protein